MTVRVEVVPSTDDKFPHRVRVTTRDAQGVLQGVRNHRARTEGEAHDIAARIAEACPNLEQRECAS
jgi:hypothetical protein